MNLYKLKNRSAQSPTSYRFSAGQDDLEAILLPTDGNIEAETKQEESASQETNMVVTAPHNDETQPLLEEFEVSPSDSPPSHNQGNIISRRATDSVLSRLKERLPRMAERFERLRDKKASFSDVDEPVSQEISYLRQSGSEPSICDVGGELIEEGVECCDDGESKPPWIKGSNLKTPVTSMTLSSLKDFDYDHQFRSEPTSTIEQSQPMAQEATARLEEPAIPSMVHLPPAPTPLDQGSNSFLSFKNIFLSIIILSLAILLSTPLKTFVQGFILGFALSTIIGMILWWFFRPSHHWQRSRAPQITDLPPLSIPFVARADENSDVFKGWMNELSEEYNPDTVQSNDTNSVLITVDKTNLELSSPKNNIPRRAMWNEPVHKHIFVKKRFFNISSASLALLPAGLSVKRRWSRRYPIQITIPPMANPLDSGMEPSNGAELVLFARTDREKEEWFQRFQKAIKFWSVISTTQKDEEATEPELQVLPHLVSPQLPLSQQLEFSRFIIALFHSSQAGEGNLSWLNVLVGRLLFTFLVQQHWNTYIRKKLQKKLNNLKLPDVVEELKVVKADLGTNLPRVLRVSEPHLNDQGVWLDVELLYEGTASATLETKVNLLQAARPRDSLVMVDDDSPNSSSNEDLSNLESNSSSPSAGSTGKKWLVDRIAKSQYFQLVVENKYIKRAVEEMSNTPLVLKVEVRHLHGTLALNLPPHPSDRLWYGFRGLPTLDLHASPTLGTYKVRYDPITEWIERRLILELQKLLVLPNMDDIYLPFLAHSPS